MHNFYRKITKELLVIVLICGTFLVSYFLFSFVSFYLNTSSQYSKILEKRKDNLESLSSSFNYMLAEDKTISREVNCDFTANKVSGSDLKKIQALSDLLFTLTKIGNINFAVLKFNGITLFTTRGKKFRCGIDENLEADYKASAKAEILSTVILKTITVENITLTTGIPILGNKDVVNEFISSVSIFVNDTIFLTLVLMVIILYYLSDFIFLYKIIGQSNWKQLLREKVQDGKSKTLTQFVGSVLLLNEELEKQNKKLKHGFDSAYLKYIENEDSEKILKNVVYVELDWINHTPYINKFGLAEVVSIKNRINHLGRVIISRYEGLVLEAKSDMVSFIIESGNSLLENKLLALSCVRDFFAAINNLESQLPNREIKIKYRGCLIVGDFEFQMTDDNYNLNSDVYYMASRLSKATVSQENHLALLCRDIQGVEQLASLTPSQSEMFKGLGVHAFCQVDIFSDLKTVFAEKKLEMLRYFRSEDDIIMIMEYCVEAVNNSDFSTLGKIYSQLRDFHLEEFITTHQLPNQYLNLLNTVVEKNCGEQYIASTVSLSKVLFSAQMSTEMITEHFKKMAETEMPRVKANLLEAYNELTQFRDQSWGLSLIDFESNRLRGNIIIGGCQDEISDFYKEKIEELLLNESDLYVASGIFVMGHLYRLFYTKNKVYFGNNDWFKKVPKVIKKFVNHDSVVVKKRAHEELKKILYLD